MNRKRLSLQTFGKELAQLLFRSTPLLASAAGLTALLLVFEFNLLEATLYDLRMSVSNRYQADPRIVVITLDEESEKELKDHAPLPLNHHSQLLQKLSAANPLAVGYLIPMNYVHQIDPELFNGAVGKAFMETANNMESRGIPVLMGSTFDINGEVLSPYPLSTLKHAFAKIHKDGNVFADDKVARRSHLTLYQRPTFHRLLAEKAGIHSPGFEPAGSFEVSEIDSRYFFYRYHGSPTFNEKDSYRRYSFKDVLLDKVKSKDLEGKIILVGTLLKQNPEDFVKTPYHKKAAIHPKILVHANILDTLIHDQGIIIAPRWINWILTFIVVTFVLWWVLNSKPLYGVFATLGLALIVMLLGNLLFQGWGQRNGLWLQLSQPLVGIFLAYYLVVPYRLIREYKKRWDYQKQNEVLTEVEELKTNFLSLVTHDLKTPVARIQGLAEVLKMKIGKGISEQELESLEHIIGSTEELNRFISSILELSKIESDKIQLHLETKDINLLIEKCIDRYTATANRRGIRIEQQLEPLFPIKFDPSLVAKVISNLIDNAIKYSHDQSTILVSSRENQEYVEISIKDCGMGMSPEELKNMFTKFYRVKNEKTEGIKGTGLGLYLTRYFIEAHAGQVTAESRLGEGSTFRIHLPLNLDDALAKTVIRQSGRPGLQFFKQGMNRWVSSNKEKKNV